MTSEKYLRPLSNHRITNVNIAVDQLEERLLNLAIAWLPGQKQPPLSIRYVSRKEYRWSTHIVYEIDLENSDDTKRILVKVLHEHDTCGREQGFYVRPETSVESECLALLSIYGELGSGQVDGLTAVQPLAFFSDLNALVLDYLPGKNLLVALLAAGGPLPQPKKLESVVDTAYKSGRLIASIHRIPNDGYPGMDLFSHDQFNQFLQVTLRRLIELEDNKQAINIIKDLCQKVVRIAGNYSGMMCTSHLHGDFYPENIVRLNNGSVYLVDTTLRRIGPIEEDIAKFLVGVETTKRQIAFGFMGMSDDVSRLVELNLLKGYRSIDHFDDTVLLLFKFVALLQRWIEILGVMQYRTPPTISTIIRRLRITPFMVNFLIKTRFELGHE